MLGGRSVENGFMAGSGEGVRFSLPQAAAADAGREITLGIRPEHVELARERPMFSLNVDFVEALGADTLVHGHLGANAALTVRLPGITRVAAGDVVPLTVAPERLHLFDARTGARIN
jgi:sn-glycerol 3-phosphate transport system ATP-binding protein